MEQPHFQGQINPALNISDEEHTLKTVVEESANNNTRSATAGGPKNEEKSHKLYYGVDDVPPLLWSIVLGFQHYLTMFGGTISLPFILTPALCMEQDDPARSYIVSTIIFVSGLVTLMQCTLGVRLPIIQGGTFAFLVPTFAILNLPIWKCPDSEVMANMTYEEKTEVWQLRMREIQGAIIFASLFQVALGFFGIVGLVLRYITPLTIAPAITMVGLTLFEVAGRMAGKNWSISVSTIVLVVLFSQYMRNVGFPIPRYRKGEGFSLQYVKIFLLLPVLLALVIMWVLCVVLTACEVFPEGSPARTDIKLRILYESPWFRFPYPFQWGIPTVSTAGVFGMLAGVLASAIESIGDYYACARLAGAKPPPVHAINRGIGIEGIGCVIAGLWGSGNGTTSYSENIGAIGVTRVGSRRVIQCAGIIMMIFGVLSKFGALFVTIPEPIIAGIFCVMFGIICAVGISTVQFVDLNSSRNLFVLGFSIFFSLVVSRWMNNNPGAVNTGSEIADQIVTVLLSTSMFVAGVLGFVLDNTVPGSLEERGLTKWIRVQDDVQDPTGTASCTYDLPLITNYLKRQKWSRHIPFFPTYVHLEIESCSKRKRSKDCEDGLA